MSTRRLGIIVLRFNADELEQAIATALLDFYTTRDDIISQAIATFQERHTAGTDAAARRTSNFNSTNHQRRSALTI